MVPTIRAVLLLLAALPVALLPALVAPGLWLAAVAVTALIVALMVIDLTLAVPAARVIVESQAPKSLEIGSAGACHVTIIAGSRSRLRLAMLCEVNELFAPIAGVVVTTGADGRALASVPLMARRRGVGRIERVWLRWQGPFGLFERRKLVNTAHEVIVVPNLKPVHTAAITVARNREAWFGPKRMRFVGEGSEFDSLRDYVPGLDHRAISWKASARHRKLLSQEFRAERDQQVVIAIDTGHLMAEPLNGVPRLDHAITAGLLLAWGGLRSGDRIGLYSFGARPGSWVEPVSGAKSFGLLRQRSSELAYSTDESNYTLAISVLGTRLRRRSLVVLLTDFVDDVAARLMLETVGHLATRHLVLFVSMRDPALTALVQAPFQAMEDVHRAAVAGDFLREREVVFTRLRRAGAMCLECAPGELSAQLLSTYLDIKRRERI